MWNLVKMDFNTLQLDSNKKYILIMAILPLILIKFIPWLGIEETYIMLSFLFTYLVSSYTIGNENPESHYLINSLPINKSKVVLGKYIFIHLSLLFYMVYIAVFLLVMKTLGVIITEKLDISYLQTAIILMLILVNIIILLMNNPGLFVRMIYFLVFNIGLRFLMDFEVIESLSEYKKSILLIALASIGISLVLSMRLYNKREFARR